MKKTIKFTILILILVSLIACSNDTKQPETKETEDITQSKETEEESTEEPTNTNETQPQETSESNVTDEEEETSESQETSDVDEANTYGQASEYISFDKNLRYHFEGDGSEYSTFDTYVDYVTDNKIQFRTNNGGTETVEVIQKTEDALIRSFRLDECYYRENLTSKETANKEIIIKEPVAKGNSWTTPDGNTRTITDVKVMISTPAGDFETIEITEKVSSGSIKEYFAKGIGLIKSVYLDDDLEVSSTLSKIEENVPLIQNVRFFYPNEEISGIVSDTKQVSFRTNDMTKMILEREYKNLEKDNLNPVIPKNAKILSLYLHDDGAVYIDFSKELIDEMNAGSGYEGLILQSIANTFGYYYGVDEVYLTVENNIYQSGHITFDEFEKIKVNIED